MNIRLRLLLTVLMAFSAVFASAKPEFLDLFVKHYNVAPTSTLGTAGCAICHNGPPVRNDFGRALQKLIKASGGRELTDDILQQAENLDSDGDGWTNGDEIKKGFLPGDKTSHPSGTPPPIQSSNAPPTKTGGAGGSIIPSHAYHPAMVHFPIALFLFGAFLEFAGIRKGIPAMGSAALWNLIGALVSMLVVVPTGVGAWLIGGHKLEGTMLIHLLLAISSLALMIGTLYARKRFGNESKAYWVILVVGVMAISATGFFGGELVFG